MQIDVYVCVCVCVSNIPIFPLLILPPPSPSTFPTQKYTKKQAPEINILLSPDPYPHWTIRECLEQPEAIARALAFGGRMSDTRVFLGGLDRQKERMRGIQHMVGCGCVVGGWGLGVGGWDGRRVGTRQSVSCLCLLPLSFTQTPFHLTHNRS